MNRKIVFGISAVALVAAFIIASSLYRSQRANKLGFMAQENASTFVRDHSPIRGDDAAKVYIVEFTDPACETCAAFSDFVKQFMAAYPGKIKLVIRYAPFHHGSSDVVKILVAARKQDKSSGRRSTSCMRRKRSGRSTIRSSWTGSGRSSSAPASTCAPSEPA